MTNTQLYLAIGIPSLLVLLNMVINFSAMEDLRSDMKDLRSDMNGEVGNFLSEMRDLRSDMNAGFPK